MTEVLYVGSHASFERSDARGSLTRLEELGVHVVDATECREQAAVYKDVYSVPLGDAFFARDCGQGR
jgi:hypothetical protein